MKTIPLSHDEYPPFFYLSQVLKHYPKSAYTYLSLWRNKNKENVVIIEKKSIHLELLIHPSKFFNDIIKLSDEGLLSFIEKEGTFHLELTDWQEDMELAAW
jgi:hypothetical protein